MPHRRVIVIGAGAAGLMAALDLHDADIDVTVLEARDRVGGRIHTVRFPNGRWANAGAEWVNTDHYLVRELAAAYGLSLVPDSGLQASVVSGRLELLEPEGTEHLGEAIAALSNTLTDPEHPWDDPAARKLDQVSVSDWLDQQGFSDMVRASFEAFLRGEFMVEASQLSLAMIAVQNRLEDNDTAYRFTHGTAVLPEAMAKTLGHERVRLGEPVERIDHTTANVTVTTDKGQYTADDVIITVPLPVLATIDIEPAIAIPSIGYGHGGKLMLPFKRAAWRDLADAAEHEDSEHIAELTHNAVFDADFDFVYENAPHQSGPGHVLTAYGTTPVAAQQVEAAFRTWIRNLGEPLAEPISAWWSQEKESRCTYSAFAPGQLDALYQIRQPYGRIHFAGEHTEVVNGFVESALRSGRRVAKRLTIH